MRVTINHHVASNEKLFDISLNLAGCDVIGHFTKASNLVGLLWKFRQVQSLQIYA